MLESMYVYSMPRVLLLALQKLFKKKKIKREKEEFASMYTYNTYKTRKEKSSFIALSNNFNLWFIIIRLNTEMIMCLNTHLKREGEPGMEPQVGTQHLRG